MISPTVLRKIEGSIQEVVARSIEKNQGRLGSGLAGVAGVSFATQVSILSQPHKHSSRSAEGYHVCPVYKNLQV